MPDISSQIHIQHVKILVKKLTEEERADIFKQFWALGDRQKQNSFLLSCTDVLRKAEFIRKVEIVSLRCE